MKIGDKVKVVVGTYEAYPVGSEGTISLIEQGWDDEGVLISVLYISQRDIESMVSLVKEWDHGNA